MLSLNNRNVFKALYFLVQKPLENYVLNQVHMIFFASSISKGISRICVMIGRLIWQALKKAKSPPHTVHCKHFDRKNVCSVCTQQAWQFQSGIH